MGSTLRNFGNLLTSSAGRRKELRDASVHEVCCGLDVHKKSVTAGVVWATGRRRQTREFARFTKKLLEMSDWLRSCGVTHVALESTGGYWKPVWNQRAVVHLLAADGWQSTRDLRRELRQRQAKQAAG
jgi:hypothetical protein